MSNRLMGLFIILAFILSGIGFYMYSYITYTGQIVLNTNIGNYKVELKNSKTFKTIEKECSEEKCEVLEVPPFDYEVRITKDGYKNYEGKISVKRREIKSVVFVLEKDTKLTAVTPLVREPQLSNSGGLQGEKKEKIISTQEKLKRLQNKKQYYAYFAIKNFGEVYFKREEKKVNVYVKNELGNEVRISYFNIFVDSSKIRVEKVLGDDSKVFIKYGEESFLYNSITASFSKISLNIPIKYIKTGIDRALQFVTDKGTFIYRDKEFEYFSLFEDFVYKEGNYIGIVRGDDERRKKNLGFDTEIGTLVVLHNPETKEKRILLKPDFDIQKILIESENLTIISNQGKEFNLQNY